MLWRRIEMLSIAPKNVLVLAALTEATGNASTARRIAEQLAAVHRVTLIDARETSPARLRALHTDRRLDAAIGIHAWFAGRHLHALGTPYALVFGGTDLYEPMHELLYAEMARAVASATRLLAFSTQNRERAESVWPATPGRVRLASQAVALLDLPCDFSLRARLRLAPDDLMIVLPSGIRRVKDPLHAIEGFAGVRALHPRAHLVIAGPILEPDHARDVLARVREGTGIHYVGALPRRQLCAAMREADVVLNSSVHEGMCGTVLEAMALGTPVVARRNPGNEALVVHGATGLLYAAPAELAGRISALCQSRELRERIVSAARHAVDERHSLAAERRAYLELVDELACERGARAELATEGSRS